MKMYLLSTHSKKKKMIQYYFIKREMIKIILSIIFQLSSYTEWMNLLLNFYKTYMSPQINDKFIRFGRKKKWLKDG
jgi:hypothetical protein